MKLLVDTSVLIDHLRGDSRATELLTAAVKNADELWSVTVVRFEVLAGMRRGEEAVTLGLLSLFRWQDVTVELADRASALARQYMKRYPGVDTADYLVAAAVESLKSRLVTQNIKHFPMIHGLRAAY